MYRPTAVDLFSGAGGLTQGFIENYDVLFGVEHDKDAATTYSANFDHPMLNSDITKLDAKKLAEEYGEADLIFGGPPCFVAGTRVLTQEGYKPIEDVTLDDTLLTHTDTFQPIVNLQRKIYSGTMVNIRIKYHPEKIVCTKEHPFYVREKTRLWNNTTRRYSISYKEPEWKEAKDLTLNDYFGMVVNTKSIIPTFNFTQIINQHKQVDQTILMDNPDYWFLMGYFVGDGWIEESKKCDGRLKHTIRFAINNTDEEYVYNRLNTVLNIVDKKCDSGKCKKFGCSNWIWYTILSKFGKYAHGKLIPEWVQDAPTHLIKEFIDGYMKADGCIRGNKLKLTTVSYNLAFGLQRLYLKLGHIFSITKTKRPSTCVIQGRTVNQRDTYTVAGHLNCKRYSSFIENGYVWFDPTSINYDEVTNVPVFNFEVKTDNSYIVENTIVHNCQGFSMAGKRDNKDPRNSLFMDYLRFVEAFNPRYFVLENVPGILTMKTATGELVVNIIASEVSKLGYGLKYKKLYAPDFGVPQKRRRVIFLGWRNDQVEPEFPEPSHTKETYVPTSQILITREDVPAKYYHSQKMIDGFMERLRKNKELGRGFGAQFIKEAEPCYTISARYYKDGCDALVRYSETEIRKLTEKEAARVQTFPDTFVFPVSSVQTYKQIGNAVPCLLGKAIASSLLKVFHA